MCKSNKIKCPRCGGSGKTEFSHVVDGICFMCGGFGEVFSKRVEELTEKAKKRKANKESKMYAKLKEQEERENIYWDKVYSEITKRNEEFFNNYKCSTNEGAKQFYKQVKGISEALGLNKNTPKKEVIDMFSNFFENKILHFRLEISKYTLKHHNFCFINLDGRENDLTNCMHEVQNLIKK